MRIGLISDTHGYLDPQVYTYFEECDEIWHAGDFGGVHVSEELSAFRPLRGVYGNIDDTALRRLHPLDLKFDLDGVRIWMTHIGGYPKRYNKRVRTQLQDDAPDVFICGHSHILKVVRDPSYQRMLVLNPGAAGKHGFHHVRTMMRFTIAKGTIDDLDVIELGPRSGLGKGSPS